MRRFPSHEGGGAMSGFPENVRRGMEACGIDPVLTGAILDDWNSGLYANVKPVRASGVPVVDDSTVVALGRARNGRTLSFRVPANAALARLAGLGLTLPEAVRRENSLFVFDEKTLRSIGETLLPRTAFGVLNGGSATSYADGKKNRVFGAEVAAALAPGFEALAPLCRDRPKGLTPAYINPDGSPGASFLALKMRARLIAATRGAAKTGTADAHDLHASGDRAVNAGTADAPLFMPLFQMSSSGNNAELKTAYAEAARDPFLAPLAARTGLDAASWSTGVQPMIAAFTHSSEGEPKRVFSRAYGEEGRYLPLPGGHGQCFRVLAPVLRELHASGVRFACLGNVDNIAYFPDPVEIALLTLSGQPAGFDFAFRTPVDVKGGILVETEVGRTIADIGPAISFDEVRRLEDSGNVILFNCASGIFDLDWLVPRLDELGRTLPVRFTDQDKDSGRYSQAEQVTWEIAGLLPGFLAFAVDKYERFIAAKLLVETLLTSGAASGDPRLPKDMASTQERLQAGLASTLVERCGLELRNGRWTPSEFG
ncbi:MAG: UTP--glucose-1-phosphate uridylyltransferase [Rectinemataceae bacterium]